MSRIKITANTMYIQVCIMNIVSYFLWFNSVSTAGLYLPTMYLVSLASQLFNVHTSAYDQLLAANLLLFETILTF